MRRPSPGNIPKTPVGWQIKHCAGKSSIFFSHITVWGSCFSLCTRRFRVRPPCRITTHHNITYHITTSLVTSQHRSSHLTHHTTTHHNSSQHHLSHLTHHSTSSHSCTVTAHSSQHNSSSHSCTAQLITPLVAAQLIITQLHCTHSCTAQLITPLVTAQLIITQLAFVWQAQYTEPSAGAAARVAAAGPRLAVAHPLPKKIPSPPSEEDPPLPLNTPPPLLLFERGRGLGHRVRQRPPVIYF